MGMSMSLAAKMLLVMSPGVGSTTYLLRDEFTTALTAGNVDGTTAEPGGEGTTAQKTRSVTDTESKLSLSGGRLQFAGGKATPGFGDPGLWYGSFTNAAGLALYGRVLVDATNTILYFGFDTDQSVAPTQATLLFNNNGTFAGREDGDTMVALYGYTAATEYDLLVVLRAAGCFLLMKEAEDSNYKLLWVGNTEATAALFPAIANHSASGYADNVSITQLGGGWVTEFGMATEANETPEANDTISHTANGIVEFTWQAATGETLELDVRRTDANNRWIVRCSQANSTIKLIERNDGTETERSSTSQTFTNGSSYRIVVTMRDAVIRTYVNRSFKNQYVSATFNQSATGAAVSGFTTGSDFVSWPEAISPPFDLSRSSLSFLSFGDSKTDEDAYQPTLLSNLNAADGEHTWTRVGEMGNDGWTASHWQAGIDAALANVSGEYPDYILVNLGANDIQPLADDLVQAEWEADFAYVLDALNTKWPRAQVLVAQIWRRYNNGQMSDLNDTWIPNVLSSRPWASLGIDERTFLENGDNGTTYTVDGIHPNEAGYELTADEWQAAINRSRLRADGR